MVRNSEKRGKSDTHTVGSGIWRETEKLENREMHTVSPEIWRENFKTSKKRGKHLFELEYGEKH